MDETRVALTHAGSLATEAILEKLPESGLVPDSVVLLGDESVVGTKLAFADSFLTVHDQHEYDYNNVSLVLMPEYSREIEEKLSTLDAMLVSHTIADDSPVVFAQNTAADLKVSYTQPSVRLADPELSSLLGFLPTLHNAFEITDVNLVFQRSAEFRGKAAIDELAGQTVALLNSREAIPAIYTQQIAFNMIPGEQISGLQRDLGAILGKSDINCFHQIIDVPVFHGLAAAVQLRFTSEVSVDACRERLNKINHLQLINTDASPISDCNQSFSCVINRLAQAQNQPKSIQFWMIADPMRYGLANNYVNVTDILLKSFL